MKFTGQFQKKPAASSAPIPFNTGRFRSRPFPTPEAQQSSFTTSNTSNSELLQRRQPDYNRIFGVQPKLTVGAPNDQYEQEADRVADQVMSMPDSAVQQPVQREAMPEEEEVQTKPLVDRLQRMDNPEEEGIQTKSENNIQRMDNLEEEEIQTKPVNTIQRMDNLEEEEIQTKAIAPTLQREAMLEEEEVQTKAIGDTLQREEMLEDEEVQTKPVLQRFPNGSSQVGSSIEDQINSSKGGGSPLSDEVRSFMEPRFGADFSQVRIHIDAQADQLNRSVQARAFTTGQDVFFRQGEYNPGSRGGQELIAHELTHVVQQHGEALRSRATDRSVNEKTKDERGYGPINPQYNVTLPIKAPSSTVQRLSYAIRHPTDNDDTYAEVKQDAQSGGDNPLVENANDFKENVGSMGRTVNIYAHGNQADVGGKSPKDLAGHLIDECGIPKTVRSIILHSCLSAVPDPRENEGSFGKTYAEQLHEEMLKQYHHAEVTGQKGLAFTDSQGRTKVLKQGKGEADYRAERNRARQADAEAGNGDQNTREVEEEFLEEATETYTKLHETVTNEELSKVGDDMAVFIENIRGNAAEVERRSKAIEENERWKNDEMTKNSEKVSYPGYKDEERAQ